MTINQAAHIASDFGCIAYLTGNRLIIVDSAGAEHELPLRGNLVSRRAVLALFE